MDYNEWRERFLAREDIDPTQFTSDLAELDAIHEETGRLLQEATDSLAQKNEEVQKLKASNWDLYQKIPRNNDTEKEKEIDEEKEELSVDTLFDD